MSPETHTGTAEIVLRIGAPTEPTDDLVAHVRLAARWSDPTTRKAIRVRCGLSQQQLADTLGVTQTTVQRWENGTRNPRGANAARYYGTLDALVDVDDDR